VKTHVKNTHKARCFVWRENNPDLNYNPTRIWGRGVLPEEVSHSRKRDIFLGTWNGWSLYKAGSLTHTAAAKELARYKLDLVGMQEVRWDKGAQ
jgi:hypothetical protein